MKFFVGLLLVAVIAAGTVSGAAIELEPSQQNVQSGAAAENLESLRIRKAARSYGGAPAAAPAQIPSVPCPKNYLFSCQPQLSPVACSQPSHGYGSQGAYSEPIAQWSA